MRGLNTSTFSIWRRCPAGNVLVLGLGTEAKPRDGGTRFAARPGFKLCLRVRHQRNFRRTPVVTRKFHPVRIMRRLSAGPKVELQRCGGPARVPRAERARHSPPHTLTLRHWVRDANIGADIPTLHGAVITLLRESEL